MKLERKHIMMGLLIEQLGKRTLYKVSSVYETTFTASVVFPVPPRTTVRRFDFEELSGFGQPSTKLLKDAREAYR